MTKLSFIRPVLAGAVVAVLLRWLLDRMSVVNGVGLIDRWLGFPFSAWWVWALGGGALGAYRAVRNRNACFDLAGWAAQHEDSYQESVGRAELGNLGEFGLFKDWHCGRHRVTTTLAGERCEMFDLTSVEQGGEGATYSSRTVLLMPELSEPLPRFELRGRGYRMGLLRLAGIVGLRIKTGGEVSRTDAEAVARFNRQYVLFAQNLARLAEMARGERPSAGGDLESVRALFSLDLIRFFADRDRWCLESTGDGLAMWKQMGVIPGTQRDKVLGEGEEIVSALRKAAATPASRDIDFAESWIDRKSASRSYLRLASCVFGGFLGGFLAGMLWMANADPWNVEGINPLIQFFGPILLGLAAGILAAWWLSRPR